MKTLGQIAYEATTEGGKQNFGKWKNAPDVVRRVHEQMAQAVAKEMRHLHPGNELARALNTLRLTYHWTNNESDKYADRLHRIGFPVRWDAKKGRFV